MLNVTDLYVRYGALQVLHGVDFSAEPGQIVALLGPNGAGKSTLVNAMAGLVRHSSGRITFNDQDVGRLPAFARARHGLSLVMERRHLFPLMTVKENLMIGAYAARKSASFDDSLEDILVLLPALKKKLPERAGNLSGGEQQMVALARGLISRPKALMVDEPYLGLAPSVVEIIQETISKMRDEGLAIVFIEQNVELAVSLCDRVYLLNHGEVAYNGPSKEIEATGIVQEVYFGEPARVSQSQEADA